METIMIGKVAEKNEDIKDTLHSFFGMDNPRDHRFPPSSYFLSPVG
jgi:hypothetical protein